MDSSYLVFLCNMIPFNVWGIAAFSDFIPCRWIGQAYSFSAIGSVNITRMSWKILLGLTQHEEIYSDYAFESIALLEKAAVLQNLATAILFLCNFCQVDIMGLRMNIFTWGVYMTACYSSSCSMHSVLFLWSFWSSCGSCQISHFTWLFQNLWMILLLLVGRWRIWECRGTVKGTVGSTCCFSVDRGEDREGKQERLGKR